MRLRFLLTGVPLALLAACGAPEADGGATSGADPSEARDVPSQGASTAPAATTPPLSPAGIAATTAPPAEFAMCRACHSVEAGRNGLGPTLHGIFGSKAGAVPGYTFSPALARSGITWDRSSLDTWLKGPIRMVPGTKMVIAIPDPEKRKAIIDYLETLK